MIRFLIWILLIYFALRFIFRLFGGMQPKLAYHHQQNANNDFSNKNNPNKPNNNNDQLGEYVDYEEVK
jgi:hypothetical protein